MPLFFTLKKGMSIVVFLLLVKLSFAQSKVVTGKITDEKGAALAGATVSVKGAAVSKTTDERGTYSITVPDNAKTLIVSYVSFISQEIDISSGSAFDISLKPNSSSTLNDVVVLGYGTARRKDVTGAVSSLSQKDFNQGAVVTPMDQVQGKVPGLVITKPDGDPNSNPIIRLRGQTSLLGTQAPLIIVDGVTLDNYEILSAIPAADIVSYDFLKDASAAAIYGARGANGVIIITTKRGKAGSSQIEYSVTGTVAKDAKFYDLLTTPDVLKYATQNGLDTANIDNQQDVKGATNDWQRSIIQTGYTHNHYLSASGGTGGFNYQGSVTYQDQKGIVINTGRKQTGLRFSLEQRALNDKLVIQVSSLYSQTDHKNVNGNIFNWALYIPPYVPFTKNGGPNPINDYNYKNPVYIEQHEIRNSVDYLNQQSVNLNLEVLKGLKIGGAGSINRFNTQYNYFLPTIPGPNNPNQAFKYNGNNNSFRGEAHVNYAATVKKHSFSVIGVYEYNYFSFENFLATAQSIPVEANEDNSLQAGLFPGFPVKSYKEESKLISFLGRATYNYDSKYYLTASLRRDGSSKFGTNHQWGMFPSVSAAWRISREGFLKEVVWIDELKLNLGYGQTGNSDPISAYNTKLLLNGSTHTFDATNPANPYPVGYSPSQNPNPDLEWERRIGKNAGLEFSFLKAMISGSLSYFSDKTKNLLYNYGVPTPPNAVGSVLANVGDMTNKGFELGLNVRIIDGKDFSWSVGGQITTVRSRITSLSGTWMGNQVASDKIQVGSAGGPGLSGNPLTFLKVGYAPSVFYLPHFVGIDQNGRQLLDSAGVKGVNSDGNPTYHYIDPSPKFTYGISTGLRYKALSLTAAFNGNAGQKIFNNTRLDLANYPRFPGLAVLKETFTNGLKESPTSSDYWLEKASFLRLNNLTISYDLVKNIKGIQSIRIFASGSNLFVITRYKGLDPEISPVSNAGGTNASIGNNATIISGLGGGGSGSAYIDNSFNNGGFYPRARSYSLGVDITVK